MKPQAFPHGTSSGTAPRRRSGRWRPGYRLAAPCLALLALAAADGSVAQRVQDVTSPVIREAIAAYDAGEIARAQQLLESAPPISSARDGSIRALYLGLIHVARSEPARARDLFMEAVRLDPEARLDPALHAPSRISLFDAAREVVISGWRVEADSAEARGEAAAALLLWRRVLSAVPNDAAALSRIDAIEEAERQAEAARQAALAAADSLRQSISGQQDTAQSGRALTPPGPTDPASPARSLPTYGPGQALAMGLVVPGLGQIYTGRPLFGVLSLFAAGGAAAAGILVEKVSVDCRVQPVNGVCPPADVLEERTERPYLAAGIAGAAAVTLLGALDAFIAARRANERAAQGQTAGGAALDILAGVHVGAHEIRVEWGRIRF